MFYYFDNNYHYFGNYKGNYVYLNTKVIKDTNNEKTNIDMNDEFFQLKEVQEQIYNKNLTYINTLTGGAGNIGNAMIMLNNLINICEKIKCKNIITPFGLEKLIKNPIIDINYNITIYPSSFINKINIDIILTFPNIYYFKYKNKTNQMRLNIIRNEILNNIPIYIANKQDLYIHIRSGDIFVDKIHSDYSQPPLCFYQKIINENKYKQIYIFSNGMQNPVISFLLKLYPQIKYIESSVELAISLLINAYNIILSVSTFSMNFLLLNENIVNVYIYEIINYNLRKGIYTIHKMKPSKLYKNIMQRKWKNSKEQLDLMINETCINSNIISEKAYNLTYIFRDQIFY